MKSKNYETLSRLCDEYYSSPDSLQKFINTLSVGDREIFLSALKKGEEPPEEIIIRCIQILTVRKNHRTNPYGFYVKK